MHDRRRPLVALVAAMFTTITSPALAQTPSGQAAAAEALFQGALSLMNDGRSAEACPEARGEPAPRPEHRDLAWLAQCYENSGRTASAWMS